MTSSVTDDFRKNLLTQFKKDIDSSGSQYFIGLSRSEVFDETVDTFSPYFQSKTRHGLQTIKALSTSSFVVPYVRWDADAQPGTYQAYDNGINRNFYVLNSVNEVFLCIEQGKNADGSPKGSVVEPRTIDFQAAIPNGRLTNSHKTADDYVWRHMYTLSNLALASFRTNDWMPVKKVTTSGFIAIPQEAQQRSIQDSATPGEILGLAIDSAGRGDYDQLSPPTITIVGNGSGAQFRCEIAEGKIGRVFVDSDGYNSDPLLSYVTGTHKHGSGYDYATAVLSSGDAVLRPIIGPREGINADPVTTLKTDALMVQVDFVGDEFDTILSENGFTQICLMKNVTKFGSDSAFVGNTANALYSFSLSSVTGTFSNNEKFFNQSQVAYAKTAWHDTSTQTLYYYQDEETGFTPFSVTDTITGQLNSGNGTIDAINDPDIDRYSGEILYINSYGGEGPGTPTTAITRGQNQTEDIRIVFQLG